MVWISKSTACYCSWNPLYAIAIKSLNVFRLWGSKMCLSTKHETLITRIYIQSIFDFRIWIPNKWIGPTKIPKIALTEAVVLNLGLPLICLPSAQPSKYYKNISTWKQKKLHSNWKVLSVTRRDENYHVKRKSP